MIISKKHRFILVMTPKSGSRSMRKSLSHINDTEANSIKAECKNSKHHLRLKHLDFDYRDYFVAAFVRNPWDRMVSIYHHALRSSAKYFPDGIVDFEDFIINFNKHKSNIGLFYKPCHAYAKHANHVYRFENINEEFSTMCDSAGLGKIILGNEGRLAPRSHYRDFYKTDGMISKVGEIFREDRKIYGYVF